ncbi:MAG: HlyD family efflux transporter periplasmic adaptor subunit [Burkholderiales bacterium]|jgi:cobalt-zinc-cadmium efflux system membrane fusion protein|uniref:efflux RND transporter periplasmic adaptor subunit n=1 Tax=Inhella sp. TaxID=1921806 RepID=UPI001AC8A64B|nr:HlyD family efflux transporter periplasmic adaptor subunit [Burkholderiales bacterium]
MKNSPKRIASLLASAIALSLAPAWAGPGHDHGDEAAPVTAGGPQRQPDGSVFLPKPAQRQMGVRTQPVSKAALPRAFELQGMVIMDPNAGGKVQATQAGRLLAPPNGLPALGQRVSRGQVLAYVEPVAGALERSGQAAQIAELRASLGLAEKRLARLQELSDTVPRREIEAAQSELASHRERIKALGAGLSGREALVSPVAGVIASANALAGQVVDARDLVFEVVDPKRLRVEALAYDTELARDVGKAYLAGSGQRQALSFLGAAGSLRDQALPLQFALVDSKMQLAVGQPTKVVVQTRSSVEALAVPAAALAKNPANQTIVWVKAAPERFVPKVVQATPLDGSSVAVTHGLQDGELVVVEGATLVNQIR